MKLGIAAALSWCTKWEAASSMDMPKMVPFTA